MKRIEILYPKRFLTKEDAELFLNHHIDNGPLPFINVDGRAETNPDYQNAPFEIALFKEESK